MAKEVKEFEVLGQVIPVKDAVARENIETLSRQTNMQISTVNQRVFNVEEDVNSFKQQTTENFNKKVTALTELVFIGDSFGTGYQAGGGVLPTDKRIPNLFAKYTGLNLHNYSVNASGYTIADNTFYSQALSASNDNSFDHNLVKYCVVLGGINDVNFNSDANIKSASANLRSKLYEAFPNCKVLQFPNWGGVSFNTFNSWKVFSQIGYSTDNNPVYYYPYNALCLVGYPQYVNDDNIHPNESGANIIAKSMVSLINGSYYNHGDVSYIHPVAHDGWDTSALTIYMTKETINCFGFIKATKEITGDDLDVCDLPAPFTFPVGCSFLGLRSDVLSTTEQAIQVYVNPPLTLTSAPTIGNITLGVDAGKTIASGAQIAITFSIPRLPF